MSTKLEWSQDGEVIVVRVALVVRDPVQLEQSFSQEQLRELSEFLTKNPRGRSGDMGVTKVSEITAEDRHKHRFSAEARYKVVGDQRYWRATLHTGRVALPVQPMKQVPQEGQKKTSPKKR